MFFPVQLTRDHALEVLKESLLELQGKDEGRALRGRQQNERLLFRFAPRRSAGICAVRNSAGEIRSDVCGMVRAFRDHGVKIFKKKGIDHALLERWIRESQTAVQDDHRVDIPSFHLKYIKQAIQTSKNSYPGPDGIPFLVGNG